MLNPGKSPGRKQLVTYFIQIMKLIAIIHFCRFEPFVFEPGKHPPNPCYEETTIFYLMCIGSIVAALVFSPSEPYSRSSFTNSKNKKPIETK